MRASLVYPAFEAFSGLDESWLPHGIAHIATEAANRGHDIDVLDARLLGEKNTLSVLSETGAGIIGISCLSAYTGNAKKCIEVLRQKRPEVKIVLGGIHPSICPEDFEPWEYNWLVKGEGEVTFADILDGSVPEGIVDGVRPDLDTLLPVDRSYFRIEEEPMAGLEKPFATIIIGRGCVHNCLFCQPAERKLFGSRVRMRPVENVVAEIESLGVSSFMVHDDCFTANKVYLTAFLDAIEGKGYTWWCQGRADNVCRNLDMVKRMRDCGLVGMILGHESGDDRVLAALRKGATVADNIQSIRFLKALGVIVWSNIMMGLPRDIEPPSALINTIGMCQQEKPDIVSTSVYTPHPGSELYDTYKHLMLEHDWSYFNRGKFEPKISGVDYDYVRWALTMVQAHD